VASASGTVPCMSATGHVPSSLTDVVGCDRTRSGGDRTSAPGPATRRTAPCLADRHCTDHDGALVHKGSARSVLPPPVRLVAGESGT